MYLFLMVVFSSTAVNLASVEFQVIDQHRYPPCLVRQIVIKIPDNQTQSNLKNLLPGTENVLNSESLII